MSSLASGTALRTSTYSYVYYVFYLSADREACSLIGMLLMYFKLISLKTALNGDIPFTVIY